MEDNSGDSGESVDTSVETNEEGFGQEQEESEEGHVEAPVKPSNKRKYKYKVDGQDIEEEVDLDNEQEMTRRFSLSKAAYKRMESAAKTQKQSEAFIKMLQDDPLKILTHPQFGGQAKFKKLAEQYLIQELEQEMLTPEELHRKTQEERLRHYEDQEKKTKQEAEEAQMVKLQEHYQQDYEQKIIKGLSSQGLPKTAKTVRRMAELMAKSAEHGIDLQPEQLAELVRTDYINEMREMFGSTEGDVLLQLLGDDVGNKIRKADLAKLRGPRPSPADRFQNQSASAAPKERIKASDYDAYLRKKLGLE